ncbi:arginine kinase Pro c 2.0101-like [Cataglyphis hispanica]|uniref:arginine kinase Pro c 2.0101-like n=1 Tax=Cataglyphis hispanica TaxID=1086592 RepID=UPI00218097C6|nr:arginine kinase Pro c 2.0101-like [Cataglyphis hispanica]
MNSDSCVGIYAPDPRLLPFLPRKFTDSTQIHCVLKSIKSYPFNPVMNEIRCCELERKVEVQEALTLLKEELKGTYYTLGALDKQIRQQLLDDHFLFNEGKDK